MRLIDLDELRKVMYHNAFEIDSDLQKWDSGCWIRYKMFEKAVDSVPTIEAEPVVRCKDCEYFSPFSDGGNGCYNYAISVSPDHFCSSAKRRTDE